MGIKQLMVKAASDEGYQLVRLNKKYEIHSFALNFASWANEFLQQMPQPFLQYDKKLISYFRFVEPDVTGKSDGLDAWVSPVFVSGKHVFVIFISLDIVRGVAELFMEMKENQKHARALTTASLIFVFLHEWSHIVKAHIPFFFARKYSMLTNENLSFHLIKTGDTRKKTEVKLARIRVHRSMEIDADLLAINLINQFLSAPKLKSPLYQGPLLSNPAIYGEAIAVMTRLMEQWRRNRSKTRYDPLTDPHPHPDIRYLFLSAWMRGVNREKENDKKFLKTLKGFKTGFNKATTRMDKTGNQYFPLFDHLRKRGLRSSLAEYDIIKNKLNSLRLRLIGFHI